MNFADFLIGFVAGGASVFIGLMAWIMWSMYAISKHDENNEHDEHENNGGIG